MRLVTEGRRCFTVYIGTKRETPLDYDEPKFLRNRSQTNQTTPKRSHKSHWRTLGCTTSDSEIGCDEVAHETVAVVAAAAGEDGSGSQLRLAVDGTCLQCGGREIRANDGD